MTMTNPTVLTVPSNLNGRTANREIRLAHLVWRLNAMHRFPIGPQLIHAMEQWLVPVRVLEYYSAEDRVRALLPALDPDSPFDANTIAHQTSSEIRYIVIYKAHPVQERVWWSLAHEFGHIALQHAFNAAYHDNPQLEREANRFAAELLMPLGMVQIVRHWPQRDLKRLFGTSRQATANRLKDLSQGWGRWYTDQELREGRRQFFMPPVPPPMHKEAMYMEEKGPAPFITITFQWAAGIEQTVSRLETCPNCGFRNESAYASLEYICGRCQTILANACDNPNCRLYHLPLPDSYRFCGCCAQATTWVRPELGLSSESSTDTAEVPEESADLPEDLPF